MIGEHLSSYYYFKINLKSEDLLLSPLLISPLLAVLDVAGSQDEDL
jgi:hypothetical protein